MPKIILDKALPPARSVLLSMHRSDLVVQFIFSRILSLIVKSFDSHGGAKLRRGSGSSRKGSAMSKSMDMTNLKGVYAEAMQERNRQEGRNSRMDEKRAKTAERQNGGRDSRMKTEKLRMPTMNTGHGGPDPVRREKLRVALIAKLMSKYHPGKPACPRGTCAEPGPDLVSGAARNSTIQDRENGP